MNQKHNKKPPAHRHIITDHNEKPRESYSNPKSLEKERIAKTEHSRAICQKVFIGVSAYSKSENLFLASFANIIMLFKLTKLGLSQTDVEIKLKALAHGRNKITFEQFLDLLVYTAEKVDDLFVANKQASFIKLVESQIQPLLMGSTAGVINKPSIEYYEQVERLINSFIVHDSLKEAVYGARNGLREIYRAYFINEVNSNYRCEVILTKASFGHFLEFCNDFEILPYLICLNNLALYWKICTAGTGPIAKFDIKNEGKAFTLHHFCIALIHISLLTEEIKLIESDSDWDKLIHLFGRLEKSLGFKNLERKTGKTHNSEIYLINQNVDKRRSTINRSFVLRSAKSYKDLESYSDILYELFNIYTNSLEKLSFNRMGYSSYVRFLKDADIISDKGLNETVAVLIFTQLTGSRNFNKNNKKQFDKNKSFNTTFGELFVNTVMLYDVSRDTKSHIESKMNYDQFISSLKLIAYKIYNEKSEVAVTKFIEAYICGIGERLSEKNSISVIKAIQQRKVIKDGVILINDKSMVTMKLTIGRPCQLYI
jgi:hypothetical protein